MSRALRADTRPSCIDVQWQLAPSDPARQRDWCHSEAGGGGAEVARLADGDQPERGLLDVGQGRRGVQPHPVAIGGKETGARRAELCERILAVLCDDLVE